MVSLEEIRRARDEHARRVGIDRVDRALLDALRAGVPPEEAAKVTARFVLGEITADEAVRLLRQLAAKPR